MVSTRPDTCRAASLQVVARLRALLSALALEAALSLRSGHPEPLSAAGTVSDSPALQQLRMTTTGRGRGATETSQNLTRQGKPPPRPPGGLRATKTKPEFPRHLCTPQAVPTPRQGSWSPSRVRSQRGRGLRHVTPADAAVLCPGSSCQGRSGSRACGERGSSSGQGGVRCRPVRQQRPHWPVVPGPGSSLPRPGLLGSGPWAVTGTPCVQPPRGSEG